MLTSESSSSLSSSPELVATGTITKLFFIYTVWQVIFVRGNFVESPKRPSKLIFVVLNFVTATSPGVWHCFTSDGIIDTRARDLLCY